MVGVAVLLTIVVLVQTPFSLSSGPASAIQPLSTGTATHAPLHPTPTPSATATPNLNWATDWQSIAAQAYVDGIIAHMSLDQEIAQMVLVSFSGPTMPAGVGDLISQYGVGGAVLYSITGNVVSGPQMKSLVQSMQAQASIPLFIATDQEGGSVNRLQSILGYVPSAAQVGATDNPQVALQRGQQDAQTLASLGINLNFAPVVDVLTPTNGTWSIGDRSFGTTHNCVTDGRSLSARAASRTSGYRHAQALSWPGGRADGSALCNSTRSTAVSPT